MTVCEMKKLLKCQKKTYWVKSQTYVFSHSSDKSRLAYLKSTQIIWSFLTGHIL